MKFCKQELAAVMLFGGAMPMAAMGGSAEVLYPERPVTLVVGYPAGGGDDALARLLAKYLEPDLGQKVLIENRPGAASNIAAESVARAPADGYTLVLSGRPNTIHKQMYQHVKYDFEHDLVPVVLLATASNIIVTGQHAPIANIHDLIALAKAYPRAVTCASAGVASSGHLLCELFQQETKTNLLHVPYRGGAPAIPDVVSGRVDVFFSAVPTVLPHISSGMVRPIAVMSRHRAAMIPTVPTINESGFHGLDLDSWMGLMAPAGTPAYAIERLNNAVNAALLNPTLQQEFMGRGYVVPLRPNTPEGLKELVTRETEQWASVLRDRNIAPVN